MPTKKRSTPHVPIPERVVLNDEFVNWFEEEQLENGTEVALFNTLFMITSAIMKDAGAIGLKVKTK